MGYFSTFFKFLPFQTISIATYLRPVRTISDGLRHLERLQTSRNANSNRFNRCHLFKPFPHTNHFGAKLPPTTPNLTPINIPQADQLTEEQIAGKQKAYLSKQKTVRGVWLREMCRSEKFSQWEFCGKFVDWASESGLLKTFQDLSRSLSSDRRQLQEFPVTCVRWT